MLGYERICKIHFKSSAEQLARIREAIREALVKKSCTVDFIEDFVLATNEACANIILHAYKGEVSGKIELEMYYCTDDIIVCLTDYAEAIDLEQCKSRSLDEIRPGGLGMHFMSELMDDVKFIKNDGCGGNILQMKKKILPV